MPELTFYTEDTEQVGRFDTKDWRVTHLPDKDCFGGVILSHTNLDRMRLGAKGEYFVIVPPGRMTPDLTFKLIVGAPPSEEELAATTQSPAEQEDPIPGEHEA